ncbi:WhiB family transcriptional regulator [Brachybacterium paraconglomeratum]|uniref:WhiB family transcriptional regulator n=1 Tax=Brachybacterium paraconglomeratum TaxID=173362 RepID=UPI0037C96064
MSRKNIATLTVPAGAEAEWVRLRAGIAALPVAVPCAGPERPFWHSTDVAEQAAAARACRECPLLHRCDDYATAAGERSGVWGGWTERERRARRTGRATA